MSALITNKKSPNVTRVIGSVRRMRIGFMMAFKMARTTATIIALQKLSNLIPSST